MTIENYQAALAELLGWPAKLESLQLNQLALNPIPPTELNEINILSEHLHILTLNKKKAEKKMQAFSRITSSISKYGDSLHKPEFYLDIISDELRSSESCLLKRHDQFYLPNEPCFIEYLNDPIPEYLLDRLLTRYSNIAVFNNLDGEDLELTFPKKHQEERRGSHYLFVRIEALHEILLFHRSLGSPSFSTFDIELVQSLSQYIQLTLENQELYLETLKAKTDLTKLNNELMDLAKNLELKVRERTLDLSKAKQRAELAQTAAENANQAKSDFLAMISHEFRTPLNGVIGMAQLLESTELNREQNEYVSTLSNAAEILLALINDILDYSKIESGRMDIEDYPFSISETVHDIYHLLENMAKNKGIEFKTKIENNVQEFMMGDRIRIRQILINLCNNAIKFTQKGGVDLKIEMLPKTDWADEKIYFSITDTGIGISEDNIVKLFKPFIQAESSTSREFGGTGLGLAIAKRLIEAMGGEIGVHSKQGKGSVFWFVLPYRVAPTALINEYKNKQKARQIGDNEITLLPKEESQPIQILVAEDNAVNQITIEAMLHKEGLQCTIVDTGQQAIASFEQKHWDLIFMDYFLPDMNGPEATIVIRKMEKENDQQPTPIVALTGNTVEQDRDYCIESGMDDFLQKPIKQEDLRSIIQLYIREACDENRKRHSS